MHKKINGFTLIERIHDELERSGVVEIEIEERARNIVTALPVAKDYTEIAEMLRPQYRCDGSLFIRGIPAPLERARAATQCMSWYLAHVSASRFELFASLQMSCFPTAEKASEWMATNVPLMVSENA